MKHRKEMPMVPGCKVMRGGSHDAKEMTKRPEEIERHRQQRMKKMGMKAKHA